MTNEIKLPEALLVTIKVASEKVDFNIPHFGWCNSVNLELTPPANITHKELVKFVESVLVGGIGIVPLQNLAICQEDCNNGQLEYRKVTDKIINEVTYSNTVVPYVNNVVSEYFNFEIKIEELPFPK